MRVNQPAPSTLRQPPQRTHRLNQARPRASGCAISAGSNDGCCEPTEECLIWRSARIAWREKGPGARLYDAAVVPLDLSPTFVQRVVSIPWFSSCGIDFGDEMDTMFVGSWSDAVESCSSPTWDSVTLEAQNQLTLQLHNKFPNEYQMWNSWTTSAKKHVLAPHVEPVIAELSSQHDLPTVVGDCIRWDVLGAAMESVYANCCPPRFFSRLLDWYEAGRFPCGWTGNWPSGRIIVY